MNRNRIVIILIAILFLQIWNAGVCKAQTPVLHTHKEATPACPDFMDMFAALHLNILDYNKYNDSIFLIRNHDDWIQFFLRRAERHHEIYNENKKILTSIKEYFDTAHHTVPDSAYHKLFDAYMLFSQQDVQTTDAFLSEDICNILEPYYLSGRCPDSLNYIRRIRLWQGTANWQFYSLTNDTSYAKATYDCNKFIYEDKHTAYPQFDATDFICTCNLLHQQWVGMRFQTMKEHEEVKKRLQYMVDHDSIYAQDIHPKNIIMARANIRNSNDELARNIGIIDTTLLAKHITDSIMQRIVERNDTTKSINSLTFYRNLIFKTYLKQISKTEALKIATKRYKKERTMLRRSFNDSELQTYISKYYTLLFLNDEADITESQKHKNVLQYCNDIVTLYKHRKDQQYASSYIRNLQRMVTYSRLLRHLSTSERIEFLNKLYVATQVTTYAHCVHVAELAKVLMEGIIKYEPSLLKGVLGYNNEKEIIRNKREFMDYIHYAALYHDLGKNSIISIITNEARLTTDHEYSIIKTHPQVGLRYLAIAPELERYKDTTLGHHKWYNGKGGYPESFDNTKSPMRIMIDIVTLCDCMQAATEKVGRNYKKEKTYIRLLGEMIKDSGTRYNPQLVDLICEHKDISNRLHELVEDGWLEIYYNIYSQFFK